MARHKDKGKSRALETSPLLPPTASSPPARRPSLSPLGEAEASSSSPTAPSSYQTFPPRPRPNRTLSHLLTTFLLLLSLFLLASLLLLLLGYSYAYPSARSPPSELLAHAVHLRGPTNLQVLNLTSSGLYIQLDGEIGVDADWLLGFRSSDESAGWAERCRRALGRWGVERVQAVDVRLSTIALSSRSGMIATLQVPQLTIPLTPSLRALSSEEELDSPESELAKSWLSPITIDVLVSPSQDAAALARFAQESWASGKIELEASTKWVTVSPSGLGSPPSGSKGEDGPGSARWSWRMNPSSWLTLHKSDLLTEIKLKIPSLPGFPRPGTPLREFLSQLSLDSYAVHPLPAPAPAPGADPGSGNTTHTQLAIEGSASLPFPLLPSFPPLGQFKWPYEIPFLVSLLPLPNATEGEPGASANANGTLSPLPIATVHTSPLLIPPPGPRLSISLSGLLLPPPPDSPLLSAFLTAYLSGAPYPILLTSPPPHPGLPAFLSPFLSHIQLSHQFPGAHPRPKLLQSVQINGMRILPSNKPNEFLISGTIEARISLPPAFSSLAFDAEQVQPDVYITDGPPLPGLVNAFARLDSPLLPTVQENLTLLAPLDEVPVQILPGREKAFRAFVQKVIFKRDGAWAGVKGRCGVWALVGGLGEVVVRGVGVEGGSRVGRGGAGEEGWEMLQAWGSRLECGMWECEVEM
ncbi:hypothetical protein CALVIDRAFT_596296 [Calocera viscosa TUFC12733]|uniref:Uncharacterized protein n=1 Tax=Calocera viscosa (strain TUFC12733) TaxID=1330018 RepID=A0A167PWQ3_CALVF|nr:hypothetical protein CALVIDRAFT_596296 [Calocera viscosa TUFC12733]